SIKIVSIFIVNIMENTATIAVAIDKRRQKVDGTFPLKLRITFRKERQYISIDESVSLADWDKLKTASVRGEQLKKLKIKITAIEHKAQLILSTMGVFTFRRFIELYNGKSANAAVSRKVINYFQTFVDNLLDEGRIKSAWGFNGALNSLRQYAGTNLYFEDITPAFLKKYEDALLKKGLKPGSTGFYTTSIRTIFNAAIADGIVSKDFYPFGRKKYQPLKSVNVKKALPLADIMKIIHYTPQDPQGKEAFARDLWVFSYLCNGMNVKDICNLKYSNIDGDRLTFMRQKTANKLRSNPRLIQAYLPPIAQEIIGRWGQKPCLPNTYIFPFYNDEQSALQKAVKTNNTVNTINRLMKQIRAELGISKHITTYTARHSFSTVLKRSGASIEYISESLGHTNTIITEVYLASFEDDTRKEMSKRLLGE
ncbi:Site-specific recombinase XerD, partial [Flexibacter flexilis DSM 6793]